MFGAATGFSLLLIGWESGASFQGQLQSEFFRANYRTSFTESIRERSKVTPMQSRGLLWTLDWPNRFQLIPTRLLTVLLCCRRYLSWICLGQNKVQWNHSCCHVVPRGANGECFAEYMLKLVWYKHVLEIPLSQSQVLNLRQYWQRIKYTAKG